MFRIHLRASVPRDYRSSFLTSNDKTALKRFSDSLYDEGIMMIHTGGGTLSDPDP